MERISYSQCPLPNDGRCYNALNPRNAQPNLCPMLNYRLAITNYQVYIK
ncbi:MAG: hypothetical protein KME31_15490 [Tolypothrix carrinoi HA7290-LM1]|nr:hypothetical protein [Tolypothrix carrinoi HA7290-LM1]